MVIYIRADVDVKKGLRYYTSQVFCHLVIFKTKLYSASLNTLHNVFSILYLITTTQYIQKLENRQFNRLNVMNFDHLHTEYVYEL